MVYVRLTKDYRITFPKQVRENYNLEPGQKLYLTHSKSSITVLIENQS